LNIAGRWCPLFPDSYGAVPQLVSNPLNTLGHRVASLILFGGALEEDYSNESNIDLPIVYGPAESRGVDEIT